MRMRSGWAAVPVLWFGCGGAEPTDDRPAPDAGFVPDAGPSDAGRADAGLPDSGVVELGEVDVDVTAGPPDLLSSYGLLAFADGRFLYNDRVVPYDLATPLFSDYALKERAIYVPAGGRIRYVERDAFEMPVGTAIVKSFLFPRDLRAPDEDLRLLETRVLVRYEDGWRSFPYVWREDGSDADYFVRGRVVAIDFVDLEGRSRTAQYLIPQKNQCVECHELLDDQGERYLTVIGPKARHLNRDYVYDGEVKNQLAHLKELDLLADLPPLDEVEAAFEVESLRGSSTSAIDSETLVRAARDYLDINCAHCHNPLGTNGQTSRLFLEVYNDDPFHLGVCKEPGSAGPGAGGRRYNIVPGDADASILVFRTETEEIGAMMPLLGRSLADDLGARIVRAWVDAMPPINCE